MTVKSHLTFFFFWIFCICLFIYLFNFLFRSYILLIIRVLYIIISIFFFTSLPKTKYFLWEKDTMTYECHPWACNPWSWYFRTFSYFTNFFFQWDRAWLIVIKRVYKSCLPSCGTIVVGLKICCKFHRRF